jgi:hypothetical protein
MPDADAAIRAYGLIEGLPCRQVLGFAVFGIASNCSMERQYCTSMMVRENHISACRNPRSGWRESSSIMRGMARHRHPLRSISGLLMRIPIRKTTKSAHRLCCQPLASNHSASHNDIKKTT